MTRHLVLAGLTAFVLTAAPAQAWEPIAPGNPTWSVAAPYSLHQAGSEDLGGFEPTLEIVRAGMDDWSLVSCSGLETTYQGPTAQQPFTGGRNIIGWIETGWFDSPSAIGVTGPSWNGAGEIVDAQMAMNGENFTWTTEAGAGNLVNAYSITLHEAGHYYGLGHSDDRGASMYFAYAGGILSLNADDQEGICTLYPFEGAPPDCNVSGCPSGQECVGGTCVDAGGAPLCTACVNDGDCGGASDRCLRYPNGNLYCGKTCAADADCPNGTCEMIANGVQQCVVRDADGNADCNAIEVDGGGPDVGPGGGGTPTPPEGALGDPCRTNVDCTTGICGVKTNGDTFCTRVCDDAAPCPGGYECLDTGTGTATCRPTGGGLGDACAAPGDCSTGVCADMGAARLCTRECDESSPCPGDFQCMGVAGSATRVCADPSAGRALEGSCSAAPGRGGSAGWLALLLLPVVGRLLRRRG